MLTFQFSSSPYSFTNQSFGKWKEFSISGIALLEMKVPLSSWLNLWRACWKMKLFWRSFSRLTSSERLMNLFTTSKHLEPLPDLQSSQKLLFLPGLSGLTKKKAKLRLYYNKLTFPGEILSSAKFLFYACFEILDGVAISGSTWISSPA
jgi:hypothetical protein